MEVSKIKDCHLCYLRDGCSQVVEGEGTNKNVFIIGEAPGKEEDENGLPFIGRSGKLVREVAGHKYYITNVVKCRPPNNAKPDEKIVKICVQNNLKFEFEMYKPKHVILLGKTSQSIVEEFPELFNECLVSYLEHPSYALRNGKSDEWKKKFEDKLREKGKGVKQNLNEWFDYGNR